MPNDTQKPPYEYDRRVYLLKQWEAELSHLMYKQEQNPQTVQSMMVTTSTDSMRDLMEYALKGINAELLETTP